MGGSGTVPSHGTSHDPPLNLRSLSILSAHLFHPLLRSAPSTYTPGRGNNTDKVGYRLDVLDVQILSRICLFGNGHPYIPSPCVRSLKTRASHVAELSAEITLCYTHGGQNSMKNSGLSEAVSDSRQTVTHTMINTPPLPLCLHTAYPFPLQQHYFFHYFCLHFFF